jgi:peptidoglycan/xylan/chitin deacetylase (PgdA/CDA1 family)
VKVALTFDAEHPSRSHCPPGVQEALLEELARADARASFFIQGRWAKAYPETARAIVAGGHLVGNHSHYHARMSLLSDEGLAVDVLAAQAAIRTVLRVDPQPWFRCPFGDGADDPRVLKVLSELGYRDVGWDVDAADWDAERPPEGVADDVLSGVAAAGDEAIVLLHTWPATTLTILRDLIGDLRSSGASFVTLDEVDKLRS